MLGDFPHIDRCRIERSSLGPAGKLLACHMYYLLCMSWLVCVPLHVMIAMYSCGYAKKNYDILWVFKTLQRLTHFGFHEFALVSGVSLLTIANSFAAKLGYLLPKMLKLV